ncbi:MAG: hypothetical protein HYZ83_05950 [Candidatus Omnitrophica bacterium]|nr:hypothetical protein [Candidatus Omnitrophota bacterium]
MTLNSEKDAYQFDMFRLKPGVRFSDYDTVIVEPVKLDFLKVDHIKPVKKDLAVDKVREAFENEMRYYFPNVQTESSTPPTSTTLSIQLALTILESYELEAALEGRVIVPATGEEIVLFMDRESHQFDKIIQNRMLIYPLFGGGPPEGKNFSLYFEIWAERLGNLVNENWK